ncbi:DUF397 domain-containing protein [Amycolatopsis antarctica]|uniref:DUF397 domain-containing protein n=1 Tax=Amycolatopsis antarctica TaxID=1854586 RepID=A0A263D0J8_9PSEU|nr:DUF397 domain-containing protein [Amycolatopsis antarctica]OZM71974.1 DUF397 domain-containing protein [Amycolatopsis antarctica]
MPTPDFTGARWRKSSRSNGNGGNCVEIAHALDTVGIRDSKTPHTGHLTLTPATWAALRTHITGPA